MTLKLYRRHSAECLNGPEGHPEQGLLAKKLSPAKLRTYKGCACAIWFSGRWAGVTYKRQSLNVGDWARATEMLEERMTSKAARAKSLTLEQAISRWHEDTTLARRAQNTLRLHTLITGWLQATAQSMDRSLLAEVDSEVVAALRMQWVRSGIEDSTHYTYLTYLNAFFRYCIGEKWIEDNPVPPPSKWPPRIALDREETLPLDPDGGTANYDKILAALAAPRERDRRGRSRIAICGPVLRPLVELMYESGLRVSDAVCFRPGKMVLGPDVAEYTYLPIKSQRKRRTCTTFIPIALAKQLAALPHLSPGFPFLDARPWPKTANAIRHELARVGDLVGVAGVRPHRFRDSFAVNELNRGTSVGGVSKMLGHFSVAITEQYYAPWVKSRVDQLRREYVNGRKPVPANVIPFPVAVNE